MTMPVNREEKIELMNAATVRAESRIARWKSDPTIKQVLLTPTTTPEKEAVVSYTRVEKVLVNA